ncbi:MAG TPA: tol-pal system protein YbgF [Pseudolabrys sp.]|nr:tol-pal system protein YbgF [Pseudolabrys sp.]
MLSAARREVESLYAKGIFDLASHILVELAVLCYAAAAITDTSAHSETRGPVFGKKHAQRYADLAQHSPMTRTRPWPTLILMLLVAAVPCLAGTALAQDQRSSGNFLDNLFGRGEPAAQSRQAPQVPQASQAQQTPSGRVAQADSGDPSVRLDRIENALRQLTGTIEQLQYRNQQLEMQLKRMQDDTEYRFQQLGAKGGGMPAQSAPVAPGNVPGGPAGRRSDVFDPTQHPNAPGVPRVLGNQTEIAAPEPGRDIAGSVGAPGGRAAGAPLDLSTLAGNEAPRPPATSPAAVASTNPTPVPTSQMPQRLPPPQVREAAPAGPQLATLPPSASPQDEYDLAYGYVLHKDYSLAEQAFRDFLKKYPNEHLVPDAQYWMGESLFQQQRYRDAAESFLAVSTKFEHSGKAPDSLLRLGQSLAAMNQKEAACATLAEVGRKYPRASAGVKRGVAQEQKRAHC